MANATIKVKNGKAAKIYIGKKQVQKIIIFASDSNFILSNGDYLITSDDLIFNVTEESE